MLINLLLWSFIIVPWLSLLLLKREVVKRYMPVAIFTALLVTIYNELAYTFQWWVIKQTIFPWIITYVPFVYGGFLVGTIWIFHFTFGRFWLYMITNIVIDFLFMFPINYVFEQKLGLYKLTRQDSWDVFFIFIGIAVVIYGYQMWQEGVLIDREKG